jgi:hypothetical protein
VASCPFLIGYIHSCQHVQAWVQGLGDSICLSILYSCSLSVQLYWCTCSAHATRGRDSRCVEIVRYQYKCFISRAYLDVLLHIDLSNLSLANASCTPIMGDSVSDANPVWLYSCVLQGSLETIETTEDVKGSMRHNALVVPFIQLCAIFADRNHQLCYSRCGIQP